MNQYKLVGYTNCGEKKVFDVQATKARFACHIMYCTLLYTTCEYIDLIVNNILTIKFTTMDIANGKFAMLQRLQKEMLKEKRNAKSNVV